MNSVYLNIIHNTQPVAIIKKNHSLNKQLARVVLQNPAEADAFLGRNNWLDT